MNNFIFGFVELLLMFLVLALGVSLIGNTKVGEKVFCLIAMILLIVILFGVVFLKLHI